MRLALATLRISVRHVDRVTGIWKGERMRRKSGCHDREFISHQHTTTFLPFPARCFQVSCHLCPSLHVSLCHGACLLSWNIVKRDRPVDRIRTSAIRSATHLNFKLGFRSRYLASTGACFDGAWSL